MFVWKLLFTLVIIYQGCVFSLRERYFYVFQLVFSVLALSTATWLVITHVFVYNTLSSLAMLTILLLSLGLGILLRVHTPVTADKKRKMIRMPGQYSNLIPTFALLGVNYYLGYLRMTQQAFFHDFTPQRQALLIAFTMTMGVWIVMNTFVCYRYWHSPSTALVKPK